MVEIKRYLAERMVTVPVFVLICFLFGLTLVVAPTASAVGIGERVLMIFMMTLALRLWDDLMDLKHDRHTHPNRVLCQSNNQLNFLAFLCTILVVVALVLLHARAYWQIAVLVCTLVALSIVYKSGLPRRITNVLVLCKYPVIVTLSIPGGEIASAAGRLAFVMGVSWLCVAAHDTFEHRLAVVQRLKKEKL